jgi:hypothetical protein
MLRYMNFDRSKMHQQRPLRIELVAEIGDLSHKVVSLNFDFQTNEFFYHFLYTKETPDRFWNKDLNRMAGRPDHISFHKDGSVHLRLKGDIEIPLVYAPDGSFLPFSSNTLTPLLIHSVRSIGGKYDLPIYYGLIFPKNDFNVARLSHDFRIPLKEYSLIVFLSPQNADLHTLLSTYCVVLADGIHAPLSLLGYSAARICAWEGWEINYLISDLVLRPHANQVLPKEDSFPGTTDMLNGLANLLAQRVIYAEAGMAEQ